MFELTLGLIILMAVAAATVWVVTWLTSLVVEMIRGMRRGRK